MSPARHRLLWIDARRRRESASACEAARAAFEVVPLAPDAPLPADPAHVLVVELDPAPGVLLDRVCDAVAAALDARAPCMSAARPRRPTTAAAVDFIEANLGGKVSLAGAARACRLSPCELSRRFRQEQRETFSAYVLRRRIERARALLAAGGQPVSQVAYAVGFNDLSYFARVFRRMVGMPASEYQESLLTGGLDRADARSS
jgi:AraC-like DNA-binding protein